MYDTTTVEIIGGEFDGAQFPACEVLPPPETVFPVADVKDDYGAFETGTRCVVISVARKSKYRLGDVYEYDGKRWNLT